MIKKHIFEVGGTEIELTPEQCQQLRDELLRLYPGGGGGGAPVQPLMPPPFKWEPLLGTPPTPIRYDGYPVITSDRVGCGLRGVSVPQ